MKISQTAKIYADALTKMSQDGSVTYEDILKDLETVSTILKSSADLKNVLITPAVPTEQKQEIITDVFTNQISPNMVNFLKILAEKKRFGEFEEITEAYKEELDEINCIKRIAVISAVDLTEDYKQKIINKLQEKLHKTIYATWQKDETVIGGLVIRIDDNVIDTSIKNKLENLSKNIIKGNL